MTAARTAPFACAVVLSLVVLFAPGDDVPSAPDVDKFVHTGLFALLGWTGRWAGVRTGRLAVALAAYAVASELVQALAPLERSGSVADVAADLLGITLAALLPLPARRASGSP